MKKNIGFVSTRFSGTDGVSLESAKWANVLGAEGHTNYWFAGQLDRQPDFSMLVPEAFFDHPLNRKIESGIWGKLQRAPELNRQIKDMAEFLKGKLYEFVDSFGIDIIIAQNALTIPMHVPLGLALTDFLAETGIPCIAHHHDFYWERPRFSVNAVKDYLDMAFPPSLPNIQHAVINSAAQDQLAWRKGLSSIIVPNVLHFEEEPRDAERDPDEIRRYIGLEPDDILILQPTRVVPRKGIEHAITLVGRLRNPRYKLVVSHESGDEGDTYERALQEMAHEAGVDLRFIRTRVPTFLWGEYQATEEDETPSLWDVYPCADLVTFPSLYEGFGNAFLEAFYFRKPILVNRYSIWIEDIEPKGFKTIDMDGYITQEVVEEVKQILSDDKAREEMTGLNFELARRYFSYEILKRRLRSLILNVTGMD